MNLSDVQIPYSRQSISEQDIQSVIDVLRSDWLTQGPSIDRFERAVAAYCGVDFGVCVNSATSALHLACMALGLGPGDTLWTSPNTFVASANCALYCGARVDFVDIDTRTYNMSTEKLDQKLKAAKHAGNLPKIVVPVHFAGQSCDMKRISELSRQYGFAVIEDASHAIGGHYRDQKIGGCTYSDISVFSFHPVKIITTGEGGMLLTKRKELHEKLQRLRSHGITRSQEFMRGESHGPWYYEQIDLGFNFRMTDIQAALGMSQLIRLDEFVARRHVLADRYNKAFQGLPLTLPWQHLDTFSSYHLYVVRLMLDRLKKTHRQVFDELRAEGILVNLHYIPVHLHPYYQDLGFRKGNFPQAEKYYEEAITLPMYAGLTDENQKMVIDTIKKVLQ